MTENKDTPELVTHTPGPWAIDTVRVYAPAFDKKVPVTLPSGEVKQHGCGLIALVYSCGDANNREANQRVIAAAPDLLAALKLIVEHFGDPLKVANNAIAKAEGAR